MMNGVKRFLVKEHNCSHQLRKKLLCALLLTSIVHSSPRSVQGQSPEVAFAQAVEEIRARAAFAQAVEESRARINAKYPDLNKPGTTLYELVVAAKRVVQEKDPDFFKYPRWPEVLVEGCVNNLTEYQREQMEETQRRQAAAYREQQDAANDRQNSALLYAEAEALRKQIQNQNRQHASGSTTGPEYRDTYRESQIWEQNNRIRSLENQIWQEKVSH